MWRYLWILLLLCPLHLGAQPIDVFDALPALDVEHLDGADAGTTVCPMCRYGYEAGILWWVPARATPATIAERRVLLAELLHTLDSPRFRVFVVFTSAPSAAQYDAARHPHPRWAVTQRQAASRDPRIDEHAAEGQAMLYVQRRWIEGHTWDLLPASAEHLQASARHALLWLQHWYPNTLTSTDPDLPRGQLWLAPDRLQAHLDLGPGPARQLCLPADAASNWAHALLIAANPGHPRVHYARSDARGCFQAQAPDADTWTLSSYRPGRVPANWRVTAGRIDASTPAPGDEPIAHAVRGNEPIVVACEGCELAYAGLPEKLTGKTRIAPPDEPGEPLILSGTVRDRAGLPAPGIVIYAHQTNAAGLYPPETQPNAPETPHGRLRAWAITDANGQYQFQTIRPGAYPNTEMPQHIHLQIIEPGRCTYYIGDVLFADDPRLTTQHRKQAGRDYGGSGIVKPERVDGVWRVRRDVGLGVGVECGG